MVPLVRNCIVSTSLVLSDFIGFVVPLFISVMLFHTFPAKSAESAIFSEVSDWVNLHWLLAFFCACWFSMRLRHYFYRKTFWFELKEILRTLVIFAVIEVAVCAFASWSVPRYLWMSTWALILVTVPLARIITKWILNQCNLWKRETWIIGSSDNAREAYKAISSEANLGLEVVGFIEGEGGIPAGMSIDNIPVINNDFEWLLSKDTKTQFIVAVESNQSEMRNAWLRNLMIKGYRYVSVIPTLRGMPLDSTDMSFIFSHEVMIFRVQHNLAKFSSRALKRIFDILGSTTIIMMLSPLLLYICCKVKKDGGPAIYGHERIGKGGRSFKCLKFRSMVTNSKDVLEELLKNDKEAREEWEATFKLKNDPRITSIGAFLRRTSLDELPQLFNVLKGEMSLVGPRPIITAELARYNDEVEYYLLSKPGMTGLWQVSGRSDVDYETRVYLDAWYVKNWSMWNDIAILFKTISVVLRKDGAY
ncbi:TPA: undecaprenyl-phosphate galactose phosphotransferase WbaP [Raoultella ornithinolytica]